MTDTRRSPHLTDGDLIALLDGERGTIEASDRRHADTCAICRDRMRLFDAYSDAVRDNLSAISIPIVTEEVFRRRMASRAQPPRPTWRRPGLVAAAAIVVVAGAAAASPARDWIRSLIRRGEPDRATSQEQIVTAPGSQPTSLSGSSVSFAPTGDVFTVRIDSIPARGSLRVEASDDPKVTATVVSGAGTGGDALVVLPGELRIRNSAAAGASYRITLPRSIQRVRAIVGGRTLHDGAPPVSIDLSRRR